MKYKVYTLLFFSMLMMLSGCSMYDEYVDTIILQDSGILENEDYIQYQEWKKNGQLDEKGNFVEPVSETVEDATDEEVHKPIHVTFADNPFLDVQYYYDAECDKQIDVLSCYIDKGDSIYATQPKCNNPYSNTYIFSAFQIYEYDTEGKRGDKFSVSSNNSLVLKVPEDYSGTELSVEPVGEYQNRKLSFDAYYLDNNEIRRNISGKWTINDEEYKDNAEINPNMSYVVKFYYDSNEYYYVASNPEPFSHNDSEGKVEFNEATSLEPDESYSVELHPYINARMNYDSKKAIKSVKVNNEERELLEETITKLKWGDVITIETDEEYRVFCSQFSIDIPEKFENGYRYTITVPEINDTILNFRISKSQLKIVLDKSVGSDTTFDVATSDLTETSRSYEKQSFGKDCVIFDHSIGIDKEITISMNNSKDIRSQGYALKLEIVKENRNDEVSKEIRYIQEFPQKEIISIYENGEIENFSKIYKNITIHVSQVETALYVQKSVPNASVEVYTVDDYKEVKINDGDILEPSRKIKVYIKPFDNYYVLGKNVTNDIYSDEMKFSKYNSEIESILEKHPVKKLCHAILDTDCLYGNCVYKLDGNNVDGEINLREEQDLVLEYELTNPDYKIDADGFRINKNKIKVKIPISENIDGKTIKREDYVNVTKKGD